jgi:hypothetical protein
MMSDGESLIVPLIIFHSTSKKDLANIFVIYAIASVKILIRIPGDFSNKK